MFRTAIREPAAQGDGLVCRVPFRGGRTYAAGWSAISYGGRQPCSGTVTVQSAADAHRRGRWAAPLTLHHCPSPGALSAEAPHLDTDSTAALSG